MRLIFYCYKQKVRIWKGQPLILLALLRDAFMYVIKNLVKTHHISYGENHNLSISLISRHLIIISNLDTQPSVLRNEVMPEPTIEDQLPQASGQTFTRNVVWNFEDLHMLIGTDLPIFGGGTHPCVSLRLRDMNKPINILTG